MIQILRRFSTTLVWSISYRIVIFPSYLHHLSKFASYRVGSEWKPINFILSYFLFLVAPFLEAYGLEAYMMDGDIANADKQVLAAVVKSVQKSGLKGNKGEWKEFLDHYDKRFGSSWSDPSRRTIDVLVAFLQTFTEKKDCKLIRNMIIRRTNQAAIEQYIKEFPEEETPQQRLVRMTMEHPQYANYHTFLCQDEDWVILPLGKKIKKVMKSKTLVSIDCEMVLCEDGTDSLVRICAVDRNFEVKLDKLVKPSKAVVDYRTSITGISDQDMDGVTCSLEDVQESLRKILSKGTILVGHALHNDLKALKMIHPRVIDTPYIFKYKDFPLNFTPSLVNLCKAVLGREVRKEGEPHNCLNDAKAAMELVLAKLERGYDDPIPIEGKKMLESDPAKLLLHGVPVGVPFQELRNIFPMEYIIEMQGDIRVRGANYSTFASFTDEREADAAFKAIQGQENQDSYGRKQKQVSLELGKGETVGFYVRKMSYPGLVNVIKSAEKTFAGENGTQDAKRQKTSEHTFDLVNEVADLKKVIQDRDDEIANLKKVLFALVNK